MHSSRLETEGSTKDGGDVLVAISTLVTEGRIPGKLNSKSKKFFEGPHCTLGSKQVQEHECDLTNFLCKKFKTNKDTVHNLWQRKSPLCVEVILNCACKDDTDIDNDTDILLEQWYFTTSYKRFSEPLCFNLQQLTSAIRSQLYFSQITAWLITQDESSPSKIGSKNLSYRLAVPGETFSATKFSVLAVKHEFPLTDIGSGQTLNVTFLSLPRMSSIPNFTCSKCLPVETCEIFTVIPEKSNPDKKISLVDDRMHMSCTLKGKHRCDDLEEFEHIHLEHNYKRLCQNGKKANPPAANSEPSTSKNHPKLRVNINKANNDSFEQQKNEKRNISPNVEQKSTKNVKLDNESDLWQQRKVEGSHKNDLIKDKGQLLLEAIERSGLRSTNDNCVDDSEKSKCVQKQRCAKKSESDNAICDKSESDIFRIKQVNNSSIYVESHCDSPIPNIRQCKIKNISNVGRLLPIKRNHVKHKIQFDDVVTKDCTADNKGQKDNSVDIPTPSEQAKFRKNLDNAASMVFHSRTGLPLTSSPAPVRRGKSSFDFDSSLNSVSAIKSALFSSSFSTDDESESEGIVSPCSPEIFQTTKREVTVSKYRRKGHAANLLGSFEESVLNGRLEPVSTVHGFRAELGASGSFVPKHLIVPVTVFFYTLGDNDKVSSPYLSHINLGKKGYNVPKSGTVQVTLFNPLGTVVKMFVIMYDLTDMPPNSQTFIRQRTLYMPTNCKDENLEWGPKWLRYLIHLRFMSSKSGKIYLHSDIRMIIFRKSDMDTATAHGIDMSYELRSFTHMPTNPRFSPRK